MAADYSNLRLPKLVAFDLDGTVWTPDMYQLWGGGAPFRYAPNKRDLLDSSGSIVRLLGETRQILDDLHSHPSFTENETIVAWVSCTDEPEWAQECLEKFRTNSDIPLVAIAHSSQIYKADKSQHFRRLQREYPSIDFEDMLFFDNEQSNITSVSKLGVKCIHCPEGMTEEVWQRGLRLFN